MSDDKPTDNENGGMPYREDAPYLNGTPWNEQSDIDLLEGVSRGDAIEDIALFIQYSPEECRRRLEQLQRDGSDALFPKEVAAS